MGGQWVFLISSDPLSREPMIERKDFLDNLGLGGESLDWIWEATPLTRPEGVMRLMVDVASQFPVLALGGPPGEVPTGG